MVPKFLKMAVYLLFTVSGTLATMGGYAETRHALALAGSWGGEHIRLIVTETGATVEYDCAFGRIDQPLSPDKEGNFEVRGIHWFESGGPREAGTPSPKQLAALYRGWTNGSQMRLTVTLPDLGKELGTFALELGRRPHLEKCM